MNYPFTAQLLWWLCRKNKSINRALVLICWRHELNSFIKLVPIVSADWKKSFDLKTPVKQCSINVYVMPINRNHESFLSWRFILLSVEKKSQICQDQSQLLSPNTKSKWPHCAKTGSFFSWLSILENLRATSHFLLWVPLYPSTH